ncbi:copper resistance CopC/CopD family protein [Streptomyces sp. BK239]|uniref:copper resistance CopC/CopD family protein n=1 Tax=Streptomyces sp. BK239 TaxID=2512155 RepID=UPI00102D25A5|nr:copper resistance protein CopC [Streptomyces sp. BK239]RZU18026.1 copper transport protein [Streptomyces sp. BK239]
MTAALAAPAARRSSRSRLTALLLLAGAVLALLAGGASPAAAHSTLVRAVPADSSVIKTAPDRITLTFSEAVGLSAGSLRVLSPESLRVDEGPVRHASGTSDTAEVRLAGKLPEGTYTVGWRVVSADGHPISGAFTFSLGRPSFSTAVPAADSPDGTAASRLYDAVRYVAYGGLALLIGVTLFVAACWPAAAGLRPLRRLLTAGWATLTAVTALLLALRGPYESGGSLASVFDPSLLEGTITGRTGLALGARLVLLVAVGVALRKYGARLGDATGAGVRAAGALTAVALALTWAAAEHASAGIQVPLAIPVSVLHLLAMAVWLGGLAALAVALYRAPAGSEVPAPAVARFSRLAFASVVVLVVTGLYQSWRQVGSPAALSTTDYGRLLTLKASAVVLVLTVASFSRQLTARLLQPQPARTAPEVVPEAVPETARRRVVETVPAGPPPADAPSEAATTASVEAETEAATPVEADDGADADAAVDTEPTPADPADPAPDRAAPDEPAPDPASHRRSLRRSVAFEAVLGVLVLAITTLLTGTEPSRAAVRNAAMAAEAHAPTARMVMVPFDTGIANGSGKVQITFAPARVGDNTVEALVYGADGGILSVPEVRLTLTHREQQIGPLDANLVDRDGYWAADRLRLALPGAWTMALTVRLTDIDQVTVHQDVTIRPAPDL